jgi:hypothetical protein
VRRPTSRWTSGRVAAVGALVALSALQSSLSAQRNPTAARFDRMAHRLAAGGVSSDVYPFRRANPRRVVALWDALDAVVLRELSRKAGVAAASNRLTKLHGYRAAHAGKGVVIGGATFYSQLPQAHPNYFVGAVDSAGTMAVAVYDLGPTVPGRVSAFARRGGSWRRVGRFQPALPVQAYVLRTGPLAFGVATVEVFLGADRQDCYLKTWSLSAAGMTLRHARAARMVDCQVEPTDSTIAVAYDTFPAFLRTGVLGVRLSYRRTFRALNGRMAASPDEPLNPWALVVERYFGLLGAHPAAARRLLEDPALAHALGRSWLIAAADSGSVEAGAGAIVIRRGATRDKDRFWAVRCRRGADGEWHIFGFAPVKDPFERH